MDSKVSQVVRAGVDLGLLPENQVDECLAFLVGAVSDDEIVEKFGVN